MNRMADNRVNMPTSTAGLTRYFDDYKSKIEFKPGHIVVICIILILAIILLHAFGDKWLGI